VYQRTLRQYMKGR